MALTRRNLFRFLAVAPAAPVAAAVLKALPAPTSYFKPAYVWRQGAAGVTVTGASAGTFSGIITATLRRRARSLADKVTQHMPLLTRLKQGGHDGR